MRNASGLKWSLQQGRQQVEVALLQRQLSRRFGSLPDAVRVRLISASIEQLEIWTIRILDADALDEVFDRRRDAVDFALRAARHAVLYRITEYEQRYVERRQGRPALLLDWYLLRRGRRP